MRDILTLYRHELRMAFRERSIVVGSVLMPLVLYPLILWLAFTGITFVQGQTEGQVARVVVRNLTAVPPALSAALRVTDKFQIVAEPDARRAAERVRSGEVDTVIAFTPAEGAAATLPGNFAVTLTFDASKERSVAARDRVASAVDRYRDDWLEREAKARKRLCRVLGHVHGDRPRHLERPPDGRAHPQPDAAAVLRHHGGDRLLLPGHRHHRRRARARHLGDAA